MSASSGKSGNGKSGLQRLCGAENQAEESHAEEVENQSQECFPTDIPWTSQGSLENGSRNLQHKTRRGSKERNDHEFAYQAYTGFISN